MDDLVDGSAGVHLSDEGGVGSGFGVGAWMKVLVGFGLGARVGGRAGVD